MQSIHFTALRSDLCDPHSSGGDLDSFYLFYPSSVGELLPSSPTWPLNNDSSPTSMGRQWICASCPSQYQNIFWYLRFHSVADMLSVHLWKRRHVSIIHDDLNTCLPQLCGLLCPDGAEFIITCTESLINLKGVKKKMETVKLKLFFFFKILTQMNSDWDDKIILTEVKI